MATRRQDYDYLIKLLLIGDSGTKLLETRLDDSAKVHWPAIAV